MKLTKIHQVLAFKEPQWLKPHIEFNTAKRAKVINNFEKDFFYGKTIEKLRNRNRRNCVTNSKDY